MGNPVISTRCDRQTKSPRYALLGRFVERSLPQMPVPTLRRGIPSPITAWLCLGCQALGIWTCTSKSAPKRMTPFLHRQQDPSIEANWPLLKTRCWRSNQ